MYVICFCLAVNSLSYQNESSSVDLQDGVVSVTGIEFRWDYILVYVALWFLQGGGLRLSFIFYFI